MKVKNLTQNSKLYTSNAYLVTGEWNTLEDVNTLIDAGRDPEIIEKLNQASTGVGKKRLEQIILTHTHYDHAGMVGELKKEFGAKVFAFSSNVENIDRILKDGEKIKVGDDLLEVIHMPGHSSDSILLYSRSQRILFSGDSPLTILSAEGTHEESFIEVFKRIKELPIDTIYPGHGAPYRENCREMLQESFKRIRKQ